MTVEVMVVAEARRGHTERQRETENRERDDGGKWTTAIEGVFRRPAGEDDDGERRLVDKIEGVFRRSTTLNLFYYTLPEPVWELSLVLGYRKCFPQTNPLMFVFV